MKIKIGNINKLILLTLRLLYINKKEVNKVIKLRDIKYSLLRKKNFLSIK